MPHRSLGVDYDTAWARRYPVRLARAVLLDDVTRPIMKVALSPRVIGLEHLDPVRGPMILAANHASHLDTGLLLSILPARLRHRTMVAAAADYFFDRRWKAAFWSFGLAAIPMERSKVNRRSADLAASLIAEGWSLIIFPEGGRTDDGWGQEFKGGAAYLAKRCDVPVIPVHLRGTRAVLAKDSSRIRPGSTEIRFGDALTPSEGEDARKFRSPHRAGRRDSRRRGRVRLVVGSPPGCGRSDAVVPWTGVVSLAAGVGTARLRPEGPARCAREPPARTVEPR